MSSLSAVGLSTIAAIFIIFLFGMELNEYLRVRTSTLVVVDKSSSWNFVQIDFNISFPELSSEFASLDVRDVVGTNRFNITKNLLKYSIDSKLNPAGSEFHSGPVAKAIKHDEEVDEEHGEASVVLNSHNFDRISHQHALLKPVWEKAAKIIRDRYDPEIDRRILLGEVDCIEEIELCKRHHIQGYPSIRIFRRGSDILMDKTHESYYGDRDTFSLVKVMDDLVAPIPSQPRKMRGCRILGSLSVTKVTGNLIISATRSFDSFHGCHKLARKTLF